MIMWENSSVFFSIMQGFNVFNYLFQTLHAELYNVQRPLSYSTNRKRGNFKSVCMDSHEGCELNAK